MYDLIIIGAGPSGLTASIFASCLGLKNIVVGTILGGQLDVAPYILNYPGFEGVTGKELAIRMMEQVKMRGGELVAESATRIQNEKGEILEKGYEVTTREGNKYQAKAVILATGTERRKLNVVGEREYTDRGLYYFYDDYIDVDNNVCAVVGGGNSAAEIAYALSQRAKSVYIIYRGSTLRAQEVWMEKIKGRENIQIIYGAMVTEVVGEGGRVRRVRFKPNVTMDNVTMQQLNLDKIFVEIGGVPGTALVIPLGVAIDERGFIKVDEHMVTNISGVFAAGDMISLALSIEQISSAVGLGMRAVLSSYTYIKGVAPPTVWGESQITRQIKV
ncbi:hypothetical protein A2773_06865 [Candidatus Gottesmanbacteria bacterium RIFCSPHIGHO2_01_FULL_39_10]|uniref:FAD/NAD(P)-binding domain-containing protein n=1 Tax=Candidatus Gottesmanbacteria bacterium RIFCSPHIGHO2_01_FULL_39_10 TaxID=1798375 RepID=A0A1F5ZQY4_9BACT|nr:MAG: hypothetical protein A2773_06865 [Candidatus Gottesmanbacteria bacterium RIFCSPHIGHO2_01_FULL_39_10]